MPSNNSEMKPARLEAFSDGVMAVIITIMVLELHVPPQNGMAGLWRMMPRLGVYLLSFLMVGIYWINHHELIRRIKDVDYSILWSNLIFLFTLSLIPYSVDYMDEKFFDSFSTVLYGVVMVLCGTTFYFLRRSVMRRQSKAGALRHADEAELWKHMASLCIYLVAIAVAFYRPGLSLAINALVTLVWIVPEAAVKVSDADANLSHDSFTKR